jgi:hypothetical protein
MCFILEVCNGRNFSRLSYPAGTLRPTQPDPEVYLQICYSYPTEARICVAVRPRCIKAKIPWTIYLTEWRHHCRCFSPYRLLWLTFLCGKRDYKKIPTQLLIAIIRSRPESGRNANASTTYIICAIRPDRGPGPCVPLRHSQCLLSQREHTSGSDDKTLVFYLRLAREYLFHTAEPDAAKKQVFDS